MDSGCVRGRRCRTRVCRRALFGAAMLPQPQNLLSLQITPAPAVASYDTFSGVRQGSSTRAGHRRIDSGAPVGCCLAARSRESETQALGVLLPGGDGTVSEGRMRDSPFGWARLAKAGVRIRGAVPIVSDVRLIRASVLP